MLKRLHIVLIAIIIAVLPIGCRSSKLLIDEEYNAVYVSCFSYFVRGENITMTVGFGKETPDYFQMFTIRDGGEKKTKIEEEVNEEYCKISFNGNKGIYEKRYVGEEVAILHCESQEVEYLEDLIITLDDTEEEFFSWIWFGFFFCQDSEPDPKWGVDRCDGYVKKLYYYIGPQGIGFSADNMDEAKINYEKIGVDPVRERIEIGKKKES